ncbi:MAG: 50S ribosomal protein L24 [Patescibacteria group bacterium]
MKIKTGDKVRIMVGKDKGKEGKIIQVFPEANRVVVEGLNQHVKHMKKRGTQPGQKVTFSAPLNASNVQMVGSNGIGRVGYRMETVAGKTKKVRVLHTKKGTEDIA